MKPFAIVKVFSLAAATAALSGCAAKNPEQPRACTLIGCEAGLAIDVRGDRGGDITVKVVASDGQSRTFECDADASSCSTFLADYTPENVSVTVTKREGNTIRSYAVTYRNERPNGEDCPPVCRQGHIDVVL